MDIMEMQYGGYDKVGFTTRDLYNFCRRNKVETIAAGDAQTIISYLTECRRRDPDFFFDYKTDGKGHLKGLLWCDSQCRLDYAAFGDVIVFDSTTFSDAMVQKHPVSVITDGDLAMQRAIGLVWPNSSHRLCIWHIEQNIVRNLHVDGVKADFSNEANLDFEASNSLPCLEPDASIIEKEATKSFTPRIFAMVQFSIKAVKKCFAREILDDYDAIKYIVGREDKGDREYHVECEICVDEGNLKGISCSCLKLQSLGTPCSHIFFVLGYRKEHVLPGCCVLKRWTRGAKSAFPPIRKSTMYDYSYSLQRYHELRNISHTASFVASRSSEAYERLKRAPIRKSTMYDYSYSLQRYHELRNISHTASFVASRSSEAYERLKRVLHEETAMILPNGGENGDNRYGPMLPQCLDVDSVESRNVLDPMHVLGRGASKKKLKSVSNKKRSKVKCTLCKGEGHNRRTCSMREERICTYLDSDLSLYCGDYSEASFTCKALSSLDKKEDALAAWKQGYEIALRDTTDLKQLLELEELVSSVKICETTESADHVMDTSTCDTKVVISEDRVADKSLAATTMADTFFFIYLFCYSNKVPNYS
ncbi:unnamed protein product [Miscanthus lutarioriparius]|uniref:SWIM-type domain-containing protein n=1 Tax=Miscanthus lutarioriparius TaxID=422564 RepID=A0A811Q9N0_9POAL|nr:unnamed protein product [Miscanthus lutarioriparius]